MHPQSTWKVRAEPDLVRHDIARLISTVGSAEFEAQLLTMACRVTRCNHVNAIAVCGREAPRVMLAASTDGTSVARRTCEEYVSRFWGMDPSNRVDVPRRGTPNAVVQLTPAVAFYRREMYTSEDWTRTGSRIAERLSIWVGDTDSSYKLSLFRNRENGEFERDEIDAIARWADLLLPLLRKHDQLNKHSFEGNDFADYLRNAQSVAPVLSRREAEVCAGIALGMSSEAIGLTLGIKLTTVQTHRKRAYARLGISSQNELLKLLFTGSV